MNNFKKIAEEFEKNVRTSMQNVREAVKKLNKEEPQKKPTFMEEVAQAAKKHAKQAITEKVTAEVQKVKEKVVKPKSKNLLKGCKTYMIGCMEFKNGESWRLECAERLGSRGIICFDPYIKPFDEKYAKEDSETQEEMKNLRKNGELGKVHEHFKEIVGTDLAMVDRSDFIVCYIDPKVPTFGTIHELVVANQAKKPIFVFVEGGVEHTPLWLLGILPPRFFYDNLEDLLLMIESIDDGAKKIDNSRWRIFKPEYR